MELKPNLFLDESTGIVTNEHGDDLFITNCRGQAAIDLANFYDMAYLRGLSMSVCLVENKLIEIKHRIEKSRDDLPKNIDQKVW